MTINWKLRGAIFRLLAAVYAELGEEGLKGRYGSIAKFFGPDATYDSVKTFFAREVAPKAEDLVAQVPNHQRTGRTVQSRHIQKPVPQPSILCTVDEDISIIDEREVPAQSAHASQRHSKRVRISNVSTAAAPTRQSDLTITSPESARSERPVNGELSSETIEESEDEIVQASGLGTLNRDHRLSKNPGETPVPNRTSNGPYMQAPANPKKRDYSTMQTQIETPQSTYQPLRGLPRERASTPMSFGYVTNRGEYRCTLCNNQFNSQDALNMHDSLSELHKRNLGSEFLVIRGLANLAHATKAPNAPVRQGDSPGATSWPTIVNTFGNDQHTKHDDRNINKDNFDHEQRTIPHNDAIELPGDQPGQNRNQNKKIPPVIDIASTRSVRNSPVLSSSPPVQANRDKSSGPSDKPQTSPAPALSTPSRFIPVNPGPGPSDIKGKEKPVFVTAGASTGSEAAKPVTSSLTNDPNDDTIEVITTIPTSKQKVILGPTEISEILRHTGIRLAEKCVEWHPDLIAQMMGSLQKDVAAVAGPAVKIGKV